MSPVGFAGLVDSKGKLRSKVLADLREARDEDLHFRDGRIFGSMYVDPSRLRGVHTRYSWT